MKLSRPVTPKPCAGSPPRLGPAQKARTLYVEAENALPFANPLSFRIDEVV